MNELIMTPQQLEKFLTDFDLSNKDFAELLGVTPNAVRWWLEGGRKVPPTVAKLVRYFESHPKSMKEF